MQHLKRGYLSTKLNQIKFQAHPALMFDKFMNCFLISKCFRKFNKEKEKKRKTKKERKEAKERKKKIVYISNIYKYIFSYILSKRKKKKKKQPQTPNFR